MTDDQRFEQFKQVVAGYVGKDKPGYKPITEVAELLISAAKSAGKLEAILEMKEELTKVGVMRK